jgi:hypothetical protein
VFDDESNPLVPAVAGDVARTIAPRDASAISPESHERALDTRWVDEQRDIMMILQCGRFGFRRNRVWMTPYR